MNTYTRRVIDVRQQLHSYIQDTLRPGDRLPSEQDLAARLQVSRSTIREALGQLSARGILVRKWGVGTFVSHSAHLIPSSLDELAPLSRVIEDAGHRCEVVGHTHVQLISGEEVATHLQVEPSTSVWQLRRLYLADARPAIYSTEYVPMLLGGVEFDPRKVTRDLMPELEARHGVVAQYAPTRVIPALPNEEIQRHLEISAQTPVLMTSQVGYTEQGQPIFFSVGAARSDVLSFHVIRHRRH